MRSIVHFIFSLYKLVLSPFLGQFFWAQCRFYPSCSEYVRDAILFHGFFKGCGLGIKRICSCHPWHKGGVDPVPGIESKKK